MIKNESLTNGLNQDYAHKVIATDVKRVIVPLPKGITGNDVEYTSWDGSCASGNGFLFQNATDKREEFIAADGGIFIGHEGECPEGPNGTMIMRSEAVARYLKSHPDALYPENIAETVKYMQTKIFKHASNDVTKWDEKAVPDIWSSDIGWLKKNFNESDIYDSNGEVRFVISAAKKTEIESDVIYLGPNTEVEGIGKTGDRGSWVVRKPDGVMDLCDEEVFNNTYKNSGPRGEAKFIETSRGFDVLYPKGSMRYMSPEQLSAPTTTSVNDRIQKYKERISQLETPIYRVIGNAICDYIAQNPTNTTRMELEINGLIATDRNPLSVDSDNLKSKKLRELLSEKIIGSKGEVINPQALVNSNFLKDYKGYGIDLTKTETIQKISKPVNNTQNNINTGERL